MLAWTLILCTMFPLCDMGRFQRRDSRKINREERRVERLESRTPHYRRHRDSKFQRNESRHLPTLKHNPNNYEIMIRRFDENKDGKMQAEEKKAAHNYFRERHEANQNTNVTGEFRKKPRPRYRHEP
jgi:hypothetical protein